MKWICWVLPLLFLYCRHDLSASVHFSTGKKGGNVSGGGEFMDWTKNPWFLHNTKNASYCIDFEASQFSIDADKVREILGLAFEYWRKRLNLSFTGARTLLPTMSEETCESATIRFQFGKLTKEQLHILKDPSHYIGAAVSMNYDFTHLRGSGFIYIAGDIALNNRDDEIVKNAWCLGDGGLLHKILVHEIGHILGFQHFGINSEPMSNQFPHHILKPHIAEPFSQISFMPNFLKNETGTIRTEFNGYEGFECNLSPAFYQLFSQPAGDFCYRLDLKRNEDGQPLWLSVLRRNRRTREPIESVGKIFLSNQSSFSGSGFLVSISIPPEHQLLPVSDRIVLHSTSLISEFTEQAHGEFVKNGANKGVNVIVYMSPRFLQVTGSMDSRPIEIYSSK